MRPLTDAQLIALKTIAINGSTHKAKPATLALVRKGLVWEKRAPAGVRIFRLTEAGLNTLDAHLRGSR